jgi:flagellar biosynthesis activator protein FlaF
MHQQGAQAYHQTAKTVESPRDREAALLVKAASNIQRIRDTWPVSGQDLKTTLTFNRKLWTIFMSSAVKDDILPSALRQNITNLGLFILNETREILLEPKGPEKLDALININRQLAAGLRGK